MRFVINFSAEFGLFTHNDLQRNSMDDANGRKFDRLKTDCGARNVRIQMKAKRKIRANVNYSKGNRSLTDRDATQDDTQSNELERIHLKTHDEQRRKNRRANGKINFTEFVSTELQSEMHKSQNRSTHS